MGIQNFPTLKVATLSGHYQIINISEEGANYLDLMNMSEEDIQQKWHWRNITYEHEDLEAAYEDTCEILVMLEKVRKEASK